MTHSKVQLTKQRISVKGRRKWQIPSAGARAIGPAWNIHSDANHPGHNSTVSLLTAQDKRRFCQQSTMCHTGPMAPQQPINGYDITALNTTKTARAWWVKKDTIGLLSILVSRWKTGKIQIWPKNWVWLKKEGFSAGHMVSLSGWGQA